MHQLRRRVAAALTLALFAATAAVFSEPEAATAAGNPDISLSKTMSAETLFGATTEVTLEVSNTSGTDGYNLSFSDVLPAGASFASGPIAPTHVLTDVPVVGQTTLIWVNVTDIPDGATQTLTYEMGHDAAVVSVGDVLTNSAGAYTDSDPRLVPDFSMTTGAATGDFTGSDTASDSTTVVPFLVTKSEPNVESELLRGAHDHQTIFTLEVANNLEDPSNGFVVEDYLPAGIEFLGCGISDNSAAEEYPGSGALNPGNAPSITTGALEGCPTPSSVDTVNVDPDGGGPLPTDVYTHVVWDAAALAAAFGTADLAAAETMRIHYVAAIPANANTLTWPSGEPAEASGLQGSNLDNNTGASTEETAEQSFTNYGEAAATYTGDGLVYVDSDVETVVAEDVSIHKTGSSGGISQGQDTVWTLLVETSEYVTLANSILVTDTSPDGLCPYGGGGDCGAVPAPSHAYTGVGVQTLENSDGTWTLVWDFDAIGGLGSMGRSESRTITYTTQTLAYYQEGFVDDLPVVAEDAWTNVVALTADADGRAVTDASDADQVAPALTILKEVADPSAAPVSCGDGTGLTWQPASAGAYRPGDRACWRLTVDFPGDLDTLDSRVSDFLPAGFAYESYALSPTNTVLPGDITFDGSGSASGALVWNIGDGSGYVDVGERFQVVVSSVITDPQVQASGDLTANLMKYSHLNTADDVFALRDEADAVWSEAELDLVKGVQQVARGGPVVEGPNGPDVDGVTVRGGDVVTYRLDVSNVGDLAASAVEVWDLLPTEVACTDVSAISAGGACHAGQNRIEWSGVAVGALGSTTLTYEVTVPVTIGPDESLDNTAGVRSYTSPANTGVSDVFTYYPAGNIDPLVTSNTTTADDVSQIVTGVVALAKSKTTELTDAGNDTSNEATIGEEITYTLTLDVPAGVTFDRNTSLTDAVGGGLTYVAGTAAATLDGVALPTNGLTLDDTGGVVTVDFPDGYGTSAAETLIVTFDAQLDDDPANVRDALVPNTATFDWESDITGVHDVSDTTDVRVVEPNLTVIKSDDTTGPVLPGQDVAYTVSVTNDDAIARVSTTHQVSIVDTLPADLVPLDTGVPVADGGNVPPDSGTWDLASRTITWSLLSLGPGATVDLDYDARVANPLTAGSSVTNTAVATGSSLPTVIDAEGERDSASPNGGPGSGYQDSGQSTITAATPSITKSVLPTTATVGDVVTYTIDVTIPAGLVAHDVTVRDDLPASMVFDRTVSSSCDQGGGACSPAISVTEIGTTGTWVASWFLGDLTSAAAADRVVTIVAEAHVADQPVVTASSVLTNSAVVASNLTDVISGTPPSPPALGSFDDASSPATANLAIDEPTLTIDKDVSGQVGDSDLVRASSGQTLTYTLTIANVGDGDANDLVIDDVVDARMLPSSIVSGSDNGVAYSVTDADPSDGSLGWIAAGPLAAGASFSITYDLVVPPLGPADEIDPGPELSNSADVSDYWAAPLAERTATGNAYRSYNDVTADAVGVEVDLASVGGFVWFDRDGDGVQDAGEPGLAGIDVVVTYLGPDGVVGGGDDEPHIATSDGSGGWSVAGLPDGQYRVAVDLGDVPGGMVPAYDLDGGPFTPDGIWTGALAANEAKTDLDFGFDGTGSIGDTVWFDRNGDGTVDTAEFGLEGIDVTVTWLGPDGVVGGGDDAPFVATTDPSGNYAIGGLPSGQFAVVVDQGDLPPAMTATYDLDDALVAPDGAWTGALALSEAKADVDFGFAGTGSIGDEIWLDDDGDGVQDPGEGALVGATLQLSWAGEDGVAGNGDDDVYATTTDGSGQYLFGGLPDGDYVVTVTGGLPAVVTNTHDEDLDLDSSTDVTLSGGAAHLSADFGYEGAVGIGDLVWYDLDGDGSAGLGEPGLEGVEITLTFAGADGVFSTGDDIVRVETTDTAGLYFFDNLPNGNFEVTVSGGVPAGMVQTHDEDLDNDGHTTVLGLSTVHLTADFGYTGTGSVGDVVWLDLDANATEGAGEPGIGAVDVVVTWAGVDGSLSTADDVVVTTTSNGSGAWSVARLPAGPVSAEVQTATLPGSTTQTHDLDATLDDSTVVVLGAAEDRTDLDFGYVGGGSIGDLVWFDRDVDRSAATDEQGLEGVDVRLTWNGPDGVPGGGDDAILADSTDALGAYLFSGLPDGSYRVEVVPASLPTNMVQTHDELGVLDHAVDVTLAGGADHATADFGYTGSATIGDLLWLDVDGDGLQDPGEPGLPGVTVQLTWAGEDAVMGTSDDDVYVTVTDGSGQYLFTGLAQGDHAVEVVGALLGVSANTHDEDLDLDNETSLVLADGAVHTTADFGFQGANSIGDLVWFDADGDGVLDAGEPPLEHVEVTLTWFGPDGIDGTSDDLALTPQVTDASGNYSFTGLPDGDYAVEITGGLPAGHVVVSEPGGVGDVVDGRATVSGLSGGETDEAQDFGVAGAGSIGDLVWLDLDGDGLVGPGEPGLAGVGVSVTWWGLDGIEGSSDDFTFLTDTSWDGSYRIDRLPAGDFTVAVTGADLSSTLSATADPDGGGDSAAQVTLGASGTDVDQDFGYVGPGGIGDLVYVDADGDGAVSDGELGLADVDVTITYLGPDGAPGGGDDVVFQLTTDADGSYEIAGLPHGAYTVRLTPPISADLEPGSDLDGGDPVLSEVELTPGQERVDVDFGLKGSAELACLVYVDSDRDGELDAAEAALAGVDGQLLQDGVHLRSVTSGPDGMVSFDALLPGTYTLRLISPTGYVPASDQAVTTDATGHDCAHTGMVLVAGLPATGGAPRTLVLWALALVFAGIALLGGSLRRAGP